MGRERVRPMLPRTLWTMKQSAEQRRRRARKAPDRNARLRYGFDATMARGPSALVFWLAVATLVLIVIFTVFVLIGWGQRTRTAAHRAHRAALQQPAARPRPGTVAGDTGTWPFLVMMLLLTLGGLFIVSALIGVIATGIDAKLDELRKGRSLVLERDHTLILGWSDTVFTIVGELAIANESRSGPAVVILAEQDKVEMEDAIREKVPDLRGTRVVCRTGSPIDLGDLAIVTHRRRGRSSSCRPDGDDPDSEVIKTMLALTREGADATAHIVAEIQDPRTSRPRGSSAATTVLVDKRETIARLIVQTARQSGAAVVYTELFDFDGDEVYFHATRAGGRDLRRSAAGLRGLRVIGLSGRTATSGSTRRRTRSSAPASSSRSPRTTRGSSRRRSRAAVDEAAIALRRRCRRAVARADPRLEQPPTPSSASSTSTSRRARRSWSSPSSATPNAGAREPDGDRPAGRTTDRATLEATRSVAFDQVIVLCYSDDLDAQRADARTLVTLLHLRDILGDRAGRPASIVSEMLDDRNRELAQVAGRRRHRDRQDPSLLLAQISENARLEAVFGDLLDAEGSEIYLRPAERYVRRGRQSPSRRSSRRRAARGETAIGYRRRGRGRRGEEFGVYVNPPKSEIFTPCPGRPCCRPGGRTERVSRPASASDGSDEGDEAHVAIRRRTPYSWLRGAITASASTLVLSGRIPVASTTRRTHYWLTFAVLAVAVASYSLMQSLIIPVLSAIQHELHTAQSTVTWVLTAYLLSASVFTPILGRVGDMVGKERVLVALAVALALGSLLAALRLEHRRADRRPRHPGRRRRRVPAGVRHHPRRVPAREGRRRRRRISSLSPSAAAPASCSPGRSSTPRLSLAVLDAVHRGVDAAVAAILFVPESPVRTPGRISWLAAVLLSGWLVALLLALSEAPEWGWGSGRTIGLLVARRRARRRVDPSSSARRRIR